MLCVSMLTCYGFGLAPFILAFDAYKLATRLNEGEEIGSWQWF